MPETINNMNKQQIGELLGNEIYEGRKRVTWNDVGMFVGTGVAIVVLTLLVLAIAQ